MRLEARDEENALLGCNERNFDLGGCSEGRRVVRRGGGVGAWSTTGPRTGVFWVQTSFGLDLDASPILVHTTITTCARLPPLELSPSAPCYSIEARGICAQVPICDKQKQN